jgi:hypothetical protein
VRVTLVLGTVIALGAASTASAQSLVPGPGEPAHDEELAALADAYARQLHELITVEIGWGLEAFVDDPAARATIEAFFASGDADFRASTGMHPYEVVSRYEEYGDLGMFGGVQAAGDAFRYAVLRDSGAPEAEVTEAREVVLRALDGLHWYTAVTGEPGLTARGIRRAIPADGDPPLPEPPPETVPLFDASGNPQPADKTPTWRADRSGELPFLIWLDDTSKDQLDGYVFALGAFYDVIAEDETIPRALVDRLVEDARAIGHALMERHEVAAGVDADLVIMDADGRPTSFHDISAEEIAPGSVLPGAPAVNGFNGWMAMGIMRTIFHITGDEAIARFYYEELVGRRDYLTSVEESIAVMYFGEQTNYSNVNMAFVAAYGVLRYESDSAIALRARGILHDHLYAPDKDREARGLGQSFFDFLYAGFRVGEASVGRTAVAEGVATLREFPPPPYWNPAVENCDAAEIAAGSCTAIDGTTAITIAPELGRHDSVVAVDPLPKRLRPPSNFEWRGDPHGVNGGGGNRLNPGGGFHGAYWLGRYLRAGTTGFENVSPLAREAPPRSAPTDAGTVPADAGTMPPGDGGDGCGCTTARSSGASAWPLAFALALTIARACRSRRAS